MAIDIVFVTNSKKAYLWSMTRNAIRTARENAGMQIGKIVVVEECRTAREQPGTKTLYYDFEFNYNKCLNLGFSICNNKYVAFCNNDLYFEQNWAKNALYAMQTHGFLSVSPSPKHAFDGLQVGYKVGKQVLGWCIIVDRVVMERIGGFDTPVKFWYSDDVYAEQIKAVGIKHALVGSSRVKHLTSMSLKKVVKGKERTMMQKGQAKIFEQYKKQKHANTSSKE
jgi:GT2 family glycosyltransferase